MIKNPTAALLAMAGLLGAGSTIAAGSNAAADPPLPPGGAAVLTWSPAQQAWGYVAALRAAARAKHE